MPCRPRSCPGRTGAPRCAHPWGWLPGRRLHPTARWCRCACRQGGRWFSGPAASRGGGGAVGRGGAGEEQRRGVAHVLRTRWWLAARQPGSLAGQEAANKGQPSTGRRFGLTRVCASFTRSQKSETVLRRKQRQGGRGAAAGGWHSAPGPGAGALDQCRPEAAAWLKRAAHAAGGFPMRRPAMLPAPWMHAAAHASAGRGCTH